MDLHSFFGVFTQWLVCVAAYVLLLALVIKRVSFKMELILFLLFENNGMQAQALASLASGRLLLGALRGFRT